jgi:hypothetical protein
MKQRAEMVDEEYYARNIFRIAEEARSAFPDTEEMIQARKVIARQEAEWAAFIAMEAIDFPILYRLWNPSIAQAIRNIVQDSRSTSPIEDQIALSNSSEFGRTVLATLRRAWGAAERSQKRVENAMENRLLSDELNPWRYPPLISEALRRLAIPPGTVEWQAANEQLEQEKEAASLLSTLSTAAGMLEFGIVLAGVAPPIAVAVEVISLLLDLAELIEQFFQAQEQQDAFDCSLNPAESFAAETSFMGILVSLAFIALSVQGLPKDFRQLGKAVTVP